MPRFARFLPRSNHLFQAMALGVLITFSTQALAARPAKRAKSVSGKSVTLIRPTLHTGLPNTFMREVLPSSIKLPVDSQRPDQICGTGAVSPCSPLSKYLDESSNINMRFNLSMSAVGAPKELVVSGCNAVGPNSCALNEALTEQQRTAEVLNRQRRTPIATVGVAINF